MKPIIVDMKDMSDSREVYESRPHPIFAWFIYLVLTIMIFGVIWASNFKIDIVVTGMGTITVREDSPTVTNTKAGVITACYVKDGQTVEKGDILYEVSCEELELERANYERQEIENGKRLEMLEEYLNWLSNEDVDLTYYADNPFYAEYIARSKLIDLNIEFVEQEYNNEKNSYETRLQTGATSIAYYEGEISKLNELSDAIRNCTNPFSSEEAFYYAKADEYLTQRRNTATQYDMTINELQGAIDEANTKIIEAQEKLTTSENAVEILEGVEAEISEEQLVVTAQVSSEELEQAQILIAEQEAIKKEAQRELDGVLSQKAAALSNLETSTIASIESSILTNQQYLVTNQGAQEEVKRALSNIKASDVSDTVENVRQTEIQEITVEINACQKSEKELKNAIESIDKQMENFIMKAPISGTVNLTEELVVGNYLMPGKDVMVLIPEDSEGYLVKAYIDNQDIAKVHADMAVKYEIAAYPSSEYGTITGKVEFVSPDLKVKDETGSAYYMVEATIDEKGFYNQHGEQVELKPGMFCETKVIVEQKSVLNYLLEKINLID